MSNIVIIGSECSGKTTLANDLARTLKVSVLPEYSREYAENKEGVLSYVDVMPIAFGQNEREIGILKLANGSITIFDTCLLSTLIYSKMYYNKIPAQLQRMIYTNRYDYFFLCYPDPVWENDGIRQQPLSRAEMHQLFEEELVNRKLGYSLIAGERDKRVESVLGILRDIFPKKF